MMDTIVKVLSSLGIAKPKKALYSGFEKSVTDLDKQVKDTATKVKGANQCLEHLDKNEEDKALQVAIKVFKLTSLQGAVKKIQAAKEKGDAAAAAKAFPKKGLFKGVIKGVGQVLDDFPTLLTRSVTVATEGAEVIADKIPNSGENALVLAVTAAAAKTLVTKASQLKKNMGELKTQSESLKTRIEKMREEADSLPEDEAGGE